MSVNSKMTAIADEVRELSGTSEALGLDAIANTLNTENINFKSNLSAQDNLISQIQTALQNKAAGSEPVLQEKTVSPSTSKQTVTPDSGYDGLSSVTVNAMTTATQATPSISVNSSGLITASATQTAGYVSAGTKSATKQLTTQAAKTITPSTSSQTAVASGVYTTGAVTVAAIPSNYIVPSGTKTITTNGTHDVKAYASATVNVAGEDVTTETNAYTTKLATLETAITALETELQGKASGGSGGGSIETCTVNINYEGNIISSLIYVDADTGSYKELTDLNAGSTTINCICGSFMFLRVYTMIFNSYFNNATLLYINTNMIASGIDATNNGTATITLITNSGGSGGT